MATVTKGDIVNQMYVMLRISGVTTEATPEETNMALTILERLILSLENKGLFLSFNKSEKLFEPDPNEESGISDKNAHAVILLLAKSVAPVFGKMLTPDLLSELNDAVTGLYSHIPPTRVQNPYQPAGDGDRRFCQGNRFYRRYMPEEDRLTVTNDGQLEDLVLSIGNQEGFHGN